MLSGSLKLTKEIEISEGTRRETLGTPKKVLRAGLDGRVRSIVPAVDMIGIRSLSIFSDQE
jgi:hypothetical protein